MAISNPNVEKDATVQFCFFSSPGSLELNLHGRQKEDFTGWNVCPHTLPCKV